MILYLWIRTIIQTTKSQTLSILFICIVFTSYLLLHSHHASYSVDIYIEWFLSLVSLGFKKLIIWEPLYSQWFLQGDLVIKHNLFIHGVSAFWKHTLHGHLSSQETVQIWRLTWRLSQTFEMIILLSFVMTASVRLVLSSFATKADLPPRGPSMRTVSSFSLWLSIPLLFHLLTDLTFKPINFY